MARLRTFGALRHARLQATANGQASANGVPHAGNGRGDEWEELRREIARCRRYGRTFALVRVGRIVGSALESQVRLIDRSWTAGGATYVLLPEGDREAGESFVGRLRRDAATSLDGARVTVASFPDDGLTSGALLKVLRGTRAAEHGPIPAGPRVADTPPVIADSPPLHA